MDRQTLVGVLRNAGIDPALFGQGKAKTLDHLVEEIEAGESTLERDAGRLIRRTRVAKIAVFGEIGGQRHQLVEDRQVFADGRIRRRGIVGLSEKLLAGEQSELAPARALGEELGVDPREATIASCGVELEEVESPSYPGLTTVYELHRFQAVLTSAAIRPEGYVEVQSDKSTYFIWQPA